MDEGCVCPTCRMQRRIGELEKRVKDLEEKNEDMAEALAAWKPEP